MQQDEICEGGREGKERSPLKRISNGIIWVLETIFYRLGKTVALHPVLTIVLSFLVCGLFAIGMKDLEETDGAEKLWVPATSRVQREKKWVDDNFPPVTRYASLIFTENNVLSANSVRAMFAVYKKALSFSINNQTYSTMCIRAGPFCRVQSVLELWYYNESVINRLTTNDILVTLNAATKSPMFHNNFDPTTILGKIRRDKTGFITGAEAATMLFLMWDSPEHRAEAMEWESRMIETAKQGESYIRNIYIYATRSFDDEGYGAVNNDINLLSAGFCIVFAFVLLTLGKFNILEHKCLLSLAGLLSVGLSIGFAYGLAIACGVIYGPVHALMPFLLLGIGVDDMFVIVEAWKNLHEKEQNLPLSERVALALKRAGVSVTVTSITDIAAFAIGASTVIPGLSGFCIYAALGILALYVLQSTFFVACLTLDQRRIEAKRNACCCWIVHKDFRPNECSQKNILAIFFEKYYGPALMKLPIKIIVMVITVALTGINIYGFYNLRQDFDLTMYIPSNSYAHQFSVARKEYYPNTGVDVNLYCGDINFSESKEILESMIAQVSRNSYVENGTVISWFGAYVNWLQWTNNSEVIAANLGPERYPRNEYMFNKLAKVFIEQTSVGRAFRRFIKFRFYNIEGFYIPLRHTYQPDSKAEVRAMDSLRDVIDNSGLPKDLCFPYCSQYLTYETNRVLQQELYRNLALAAACVFLVTLLLIANFRTSIIVFTCIICTVVDVAGTLYFWDVTIDTASSILLTLCVGLAVDYSAHVGHTFMTVAGTKQERPVKTLKAIGPAVFNGGFSTFLAFVLLAKSNSYGFSLFFRVFFTVVLFGLFHGLAYLPVILSWVGPEPYESSRKHDNKNERSSTSDGKYLNGTSSCKYELEVPNKSPKQSNTKGKTHCQSPWKLQTDAKAQDIEETDPSVPSDQASPLLERPETPTSPWVLREQYHAQVEVPTTAQREGLTTIPLLQTTKR